jgi:hypothetical protein
LAATASQLSDYYVLLFLFCFTKREQYSREAIVRLIRTEQQWRETTPKHFPELSLSCSVGHFWHISMGLILFVRSVNISYSLHFIVGSFPSKFTFIVFLFPIKLSASATFLFS